MSEKNDIQKLLKLKCYEQPTADYFERFLEEFQQRQRTELLSRPAWRIAFERLQAFFEIPAFGKLAYSGAFALLMVAGVTAFELGHHSPIASTQLAVSGQNAPTLIANVPAIQPQQEIYVSAPSMTMRMTPEQMPVGLNLISSGGGEPFTITQPAVIEHRPATYDDNKTFSF